ncbi:MAG: TonB-dependent receptor [Candidatus Polarisedimenticolia bacterium]
MAAALKAPCVLLLALLACMPRLFADPGEVRLEGRVVDSRGDLLTGVVVEVRTADSVRLLARQTTGPSGRFSFRLSPSTDQVVIAASLSGHATVSLGPMAVTASTSLDITLYTEAQLRETIQVRGAGATVPLEGPQDVTTFSELSIEALPLMGRQITDLLVLVPGITDADGDGRLNVRGARDTGLQLRMDGTNITNPLTGYFAQDLNLDAIEEVQVITSGATAEYGRADGGYANVITKSGGNETSGSLRAYFRSSFLDGSGANEDKQEMPGYDDTSLYGTLGGPIVRDRLWYFGSVQRIDRETPVVLADGPIVLTSMEGSRSLLKVTWQADLLNKLTAQVSADPLETQGNHLGQFIATETDFQLDTGGTVAQISWSSVLSPDLLLTGLVSTLNSGQDTEPVSNDFSPISVRRQALGGGSQIVVPLPCASRNCRKETGLHRFFFEDQGGLSALPPLLEGGPYPVASDQSLGRVTLKSDVSYVKETSVGQHSIKAGFEGNIEDYEEERILNPTLTDRTCEVMDCGFVEDNPPRGTRYGFMFLQAYDQVNPTLSANGFNLGFYLQDAWKIRPNLMINAGIRYDREDVDSVGKTQFDPLAESRQANALYDLVCEAFGSTCTSSRTPGRRNGRLGTGFPISPDDPVRILDRNGDLFLQAEEIALINEPFTEDLDLAVEAFNIGNTNLSPRLSVSWDPFNDGKTRFSGSWGRYYDRLFLGTVALEQEPVSFNVKWSVFGVNNQAEPGEYSLPLIGNISFTQTDRELSTPYTDELSLGFERELAPEWSASLLYIHRRGEDLLQDIDQNHITCAGFGEAYGVSPFAVCGDGGQLELDRFGRLVAGRDNLFPNGAVDLYVHNPKFNQILRITNANAYRYEAIEARLRKRLHRNWQMDASYTWSTATGEAESFTDFTGNDPAISDKVSGYLGYDQRHVFKFQAVTHLKSDFLLGGTILWESGLPYSIVANVEDYDDFSNFVPQRLVSVTGEKNDQRNQSRLTLSVHVEKRINLGDCSLSGFLDIENLLDSDDLLMREVDEGLEITDGERRFGRYFQIGVAVLF